MAAPVVTLDGGHWVVEECRCGGRKNGAGGGGGVAEVLASGGIADHNFR